MRSKLKCVKKSNRLNTGATKRRKNYDIMSLEIDFPEIVIFFDNKTTRSNKNVKLPRGL